METTQQGTTWTANQVVAHNLMRARRLRELTQQQAANRLAPYLAGKPWSVATFSAAERSTTGERIREFTADEILAFSLAFDLPLAWFFLPPGDNDSEQLPSAVTGGGGEIPVGRLLDAVFPSRGEPADHVQLRTTLLFRRLPKNARTGEQDRMFRYAATQGAAVIRATLHDLQRHAEDLRALAALLDAVDDRATEKIGRELDESYRSEGRRDG